MDKTLIRYYKHRIVQRLSDLFTKAIGPRSISYPCVVFMSVNCLMKSDAKGELSTFPRPRLKPLLAPSLFARRIIVNSFFGIFNINDE